MESASAVQVEENFLSVVQAFLKQHAHLKLPPDAPSTYSLYLWATAVASAYSFTIGDDRCAASLADPLCPYISRSIK